MAGVFGEKAGVFGEKAGVFGVMAVSFSSFGEMIVEKAVQFLSSEGAPR